MREAGGISPLVRTPMRRRILAPSLARRLTRVRPSSIITGVTGKRGFVPSTLPATAPSPALALCAVHFRCSNAATPPSSHAHRCRDRLALLRVQEQDVARPAVYSLRATFSRRSSRSRSRLSRLGAHQRPSVVNSARMCSGYLASICLACSVRPAERAHDFAELRRSTLAIGVEEKDLTWRFGPFTTVLFSDENGTVKVSDLRLLPVDPAPGRAQK